MFQNIRTIMNDRKWIIDEKTVELKKFEIFMSGKTDTNKTFVCSYFPSFGVRIATTVIGACKDNGVEHLFLVFGKHARGPTKDIIKKANIDFEMFLTQDVEYNIMDHTLQGKNVPMTESEKATFMKKHGFIEKNLPTLLRSDPVVRHYNWPSKTLIRIVTQSGQNYAIVQ